jgi:hypothetical protein
MAILLKKVTALLTRSNSGDRRHGLFHLFAVMKSNKLIPLILFLTFLSLISGYLMSRASLAGRIGISLFYKQYKFLKIWWQGALVVFIVLILVVILQAFLKNKLGYQRSKFIHIGMIVLGLLGFYLTWQDFHTTTTHRMLGTSFHIGAYLFWLGWIIASSFFLFKKQEPVLP